MFIRRATAALIVAIFTAGLVAAPAQTESRTQARPAASQWPSPHGDSGPCRPAVADVAAAAPCLWRSARQEGPSPRGREEQA
ncbi:hypothetical protein AMK19_07400 [Kitasatospora sp. CB01950]|nr:hypothetical protein AMK19_07400 [Kitasatospora sp. CB01950]